MKSNWFCLNKKTKTLLEQHQIRILLIFSDSLLAALLSTCDSSDNTKAHFTDN